jgi:thioredoxin-related protein
MELKARGNERMKKENILVAGLICIAIALVLVYHNSRSGRMPKEMIEQVSSGNDKSPGIDFQAYAAGMALAKAENKPVFLYFQADWCTYCTKLKETTFKDPAVLGYLTDNFTSISVNTDMEKELADAWKIRGLPTLWFLKSDGSKIDSVPGYVDPQQFLRILKYIHTKSYDQMSFHEFMKL